MRSELGSGGPEGVGDRGGRATDQRLQLGGVDEQLVAAWLPAGTPASTFCPSSAILLFHLRGPVQPADEGLRGAHHSDDAAVAWAMLDHIVVDHAAGAHSSGAHPACGAVLPGPA
ncbi:MAG: hypothetical protein WAL50_14585, partial [Kineosporiaceae bacterium]